MMGEGIEEEGVEEVVEERGVREFVGGGDRRGRKWRFWVGVGGGEWGVIGVGWRGEVIGRWGRVRGVGGFGERVGVGGFGVEV